MNTSIWFATAAVGCFACSGAHMLVPPEVASAAEPVPVQGYTRMGGLLVNEDFRIGDASVSHVSRGAHSTSRFAASLGALGSSKSDTSSGYSFDLVRAAGGLHGECQLEEVESGVHVGFLGTHNAAANLGCACGTDAGPVASVALSASTGTEYGGTLKVGETTYEVKAIYAVEGGMQAGFPAGYRIDGANAVAAVDVLEPGRVWMPKGMDDDQRTELTCLFAGMMLYKDAQPK